MCVRLFRYSDCLSRYRTIQNYGTYVKTLPSYIKEIQYALEIFRDFNFLSQNKFVFTINIISLNAVIPNDEGLWALKHFFDQCTVKEPCSETLLRLAELVLTLNCFSLGL